MNNCPTNDYAWQDLFDVGANYLNKFGDFTVALYGAFAYASFVPGFGSVGGVFPNVAANQITGANLTAWKQWVVGAQFGYAGFTVGGAIGYDNNGLGSNYFTGVDNDTRSRTSTIPFFLTIPISRIIPNNCDHAESTDRSSLPLLAHRVISVRRGILSLSGHSGLGQAVHRSHRASRPQIFLPNFFEPNMGGQRRSGSPRRLGTEFRLREEAGAARQAVHE